MPGKPGMFKLPRILTRAYFREKAKALKIAIRGAEGQEFDLGAANPREFSTGSVGWTLAQKAYIKVGEASLYCQINMNVTVLNSAALPREGPAPEVA